MTERELRVLRALTDELRVLGKEIHAVREHQQAGNNPTDGQPVQPIPVEIMHAPQLDPARREYYDAENRERNSPWRRLKPWVETVGVLIALVLAAFTLFTFLEIHRQTPSIINSANAAKDTASTAKDALYSVQRAFVVFGQGMEINGIPGIDATRIGTIEFRPKMENSGSTPTRGFIHHANWIFLPWVFPTNFRFQEQGTTANTPYVIGPKASITGTVFRFRPDQLLVVNQQGADHLGITGIYFYGWATYSDVFTKTPLHVSMFCTEITGIIGDLTIPGRAQISWQACPRHNCNDDECEGEPYGNGQIWHSPK